VRQEELRTIYGEPSDVVRRKVIDRIDRHAARFIELSPFCCIGTSDADGRHDVSPRGDAPGFVRVLDERRLFLPDRPGNNRVDSMQNLAEQPQLGMLFIVPGVFDTLRVNGRGEVVTDPELLADAAIAGKLPRTGLVVHVEEVFFHCGRAVKRADLWNPDAQFAGTLPKLADMVRDQLAARELDDALDRLAEERYMDELY
jgi:PPOX class probable FMN-dependent enzyme